MFNKKKIGKGKFDKKYIYLVHLKSKIEREGGTRSKRKTFFSEMGFQKPVSSKSCFNFRCFGRMEVNWFGKIKTGSQFISLRMDHSLLLWSTKQVGWGFKFRMQNNV